MCNAVVLLWCPRRCEGPAEGDASREWLRTAEDWTRLFAEHSPQSLAGIAYIARNAANGDTDSAIVRAGHLLELFKQLPANDPGLRVYLLTRTRAGR